MLYFFYATSKESEKNKLWAGMAKETAHQIGTPLSSLVGWLEILKAEGVSQDYITEIEKDIDRLTNHHGAVFKSRFTNQIRKNRYCPIYPKHL